MSPDQQHALSAVIGLFAVILMALIAAVGVLYDRVRQLETGRVVRGDVVELIRPVERDGRKLLSALDKVHASLGKLRSGLSMVMESRPDREEVCGIVAQAFAVAARSADGLNADGLLEATDAGPPPDAGDAARRAHVDCLCAACTAWRGEAPTVEFPEVP